MSNKWYDIHGNETDVNDWSSDRGPGSDWDTAHRETKTGDGTVSTVWLGLDHGYDDGPPKIFESMVFGGGLDQECIRYSTMVEAHAGHDVLVERVRVEADAFRELAADPDEVAAAVKVIQERLKAHLDIHDIYDYDGRAYARLVEAVAS